MVTREILYFVFPISNHFNSLHKYQNTVPARAFFTRVNGAASTRPVTQRCTYEHSNMSASVTLIIMISVA